MSVKGNVQVGEFTLKNGVIVDRKIGSGLIGGSISQEKWGVKTEAFAKVQVVMNSLISRETVSCPLGRSRIANGMNMNETPTRPS